MVEREKNKLNGSDGRGEIGGKMGEGGKGSLSSFLSSLLWILDFQNEQSFRAAYMLLLCTQHGNSLSLTHTLENLKGVISPI